MPKLKPKTASPKQKTGVAKRLRGKAAKIAALRRSAASKARWHRVRRHNLARQHFVVLTLCILLLGSTGTLVGAMAANLIPPPGGSIDINAYERVAAANRKPSVKPPDQVGRGSWYALGLRSPDALTCASRQFPRGTYLKVTDLRNGREVVCLVNDYGPAAYTNRVIDLSRGSYSALEGLGSGTMPVEIRVASPQG
jgi:rare lipoprotein A (peptidoglycan hydrolase)